MIISQENLRWNQRIQSIFEIYIVEKFGLGKLRIKSYWESYCTFPTEVWNHIETRFVKRRVEENAQLNGEKHFDSKFMGINEMHNVVQCIVE